MAIQPVGQTATQPNFTGVLDKVAGSKGFEKIASMASKNPALFNAGVALAVNTTLRPATILALPGKGEDSKKNKIMAAAHSVSSGVAGFAITMLATTPIKNALGKVMAQPAKYMPKMAEKMASNPEYGKSVEKILKFGPDIILAIPRALLTSKMTGIVRKGLNKVMNKKTAEAQAPQAQTTEQTQRPVLDNFKKGGN